MEFDEPEMIKIAVMFAALVAFATVTALVWIGMKAPEIERRMCLKQPHKAWSQGRCIDAV